MRGLSLVAASGGHSSSRCAGFSLSRPLLLRSTGSRRAGSVVVAHGPSCSVACGIFPDQGSNPRPLHWQADSQPLRHQGTPNLTFKSLSPLGPYPSLSFSSNNILLTLLEKSMHFKISDFLCLFPISYLVHLANYFKHCRILFKSNLLWESSPDNQST